MPEQSPPASDPRVYFAAERTLLAWLRTGIGIMAFGFVVARFGIFLQMVRLHTNTLPDRPESGESLYIGAVLLLFGSLSVLLGTLRYRSFCRTIPKHDLPASNVTFTPFLLSLGVTLLGILLFVHLLASS